MKITPTFDEYSDQPGLNPSMHRLLDERGVAQFIDWLKNSDEYDPELDNSENGPLLRGWINARGVPFTLRNCQIGWREMRADGVLIRIPVPAEEPVPTPMKFTHVWGSDERPKSATSLVLDHRTAAAKEIFEREKAARVVEQRNAEVPSMPAEDARNLAPLPASGEDRRFKTAREIKKDRTKMDLSALREAARREREAIVKRGGHTAYTKEQLTGSQE